MTATLVPLALAVCANLPSNPTYHTTIQGVDGWQGVRAVTIPGPNARSVRLAKPLTLDLAIGGHVDIEVLDGADGRLRLQRTKGRLHGVLRSKVHGDWVIRGDGKTGQTRWVQVQHSDDPGATEAYAPGEMGDHEHPEVGDAAGGSPPVDHDDAGFGDGGKVIDVLVAYTPLAKNNAGSEQDMEAAIYYWVNETNEMLRDSKVPTRMRLVGVHEVDYIEGGRGFGTHLENLTDTDDGSMDEIHQLRDDTGADLVSLIVGEITNACGVAWRLQNPHFSGSSADAQRQFNSQYAFSVVSDLCADIGYTFPHELGHNLGCCHNEQDAGSCQPSSRFPSPYGHRFTGDFDQWRTVMSYDDAFGSFARVPLFSNPDVQWDGAPAGSSTANNAATLTTGRLDAARYRHAVTEATCLGDTDGDSQIGVGDLLNLLRDWNPGATSLGEARRSDLNGDVGVDVADLIVLLREFGPCP
jgi:hypothetical protein